MGAFWFGIPDGLKLIIVVGVVVGLAFGAGYFVKGQSAAEDSARDHINTRERVEDAIANPNGCAWSERLLGTCVD